MQPKDIAAAGNMNEGLVNTTLHRMLKDGEVIKEKRGHYRLKEALSS